uniref:Uncharacterized protein n=1 Tax=Meloidogyne hapla TaxID=6305 RepID=A0A1I8AYK8_MELHA
MEVNIFSSPYQLPFAMRQMIVAPSNGVITQKQPKWKTAGYKGQSLMVIPKTKENYNEIKGIKIKYIFKSQLFGHFTN